MTKIKIVASEFIEDYSFNHILEFSFDRVFKGYAEYKQVDFVKVEGLISPLKK